MCYHAAGVVLAIMQVHAYADRSNYRHSQRSEAAMPVLYIRVAEELHEQLEDIARQYDRSLTAIVTHGLETYLAEHFDWQPPRPLSLP